MSPPRAPGVSAVQRLPGSAWTSCKRAADDRIVDRGEPALAAGRQAGDVAAQDLDEQHFHQPAKHELRARRCRVDQRDDLAHGRGDQLADPALAGLLDQHLRQGAEHRREQEFRRFEIAADEARLLAAAAVVERSACLRSGPAGRGRAHRRSPWRRRPRTCGHRRTASAECRPGRSRGVVRVAVSNVQRPCATRWKMLMWCRCASGVRSSKRFGLSIRKGAVNEPLKNTDPVSRTARNISDSTSGRGGAARRTGK